MLNFLKGVAEMHHRKSIFCIIAVTLLLLAHPAIAQRGKLGSLLVRGALIALEEVGRHLIREGLEDRRSPPPPASESHWPASANFKKIWVDHNYAKDGVVGMVIHVRFDVLSMKGRNGNMTIYFFYESGKRLSDFNDRYTTPDGQIAIGTSLTPSYQHSVYNDVALFMPYSELHMAGGLNKEPLKFEIKIWDSDGTEVASTGNRFYSFHYSS